MSVLASRPLEGQVVAILGGSGRMGSAAAEEVVGLGADVVLIGRDEAVLGRAAAPLGERARTAVADASDEGAFGAVLRVAGPIDHVVVAVSAGARAGASPTRHRTRRAPLSDGSGRATPCCTSRSRSCRRTAR